MTQFKLLSQRSNFKFPSVIASISLLIVLAGSSCQKSTVSEQTPVAASNVADASVKIGTQRWMAANLDVTHYRNGDKIPQVKDPAKWAALTTGAWCWYNNDSATGVPYGRMYNWYAVNDPRGLAPTGWHVPGDAEWDTLASYLGGKGGKLKDTGTIESGTGLWHAPNTGATNSTGFTALPGGYRDGLSNVTFGGVGYYGYWWSSTEIIIRNNSYARARTLNYSVAAFHMDRYYERYGFSVRCVRD